MLSFDRFILYWLSITKRMRQTQKGVSLNVQGISMNNRHEVLKKLQLRNQEIR